MKGNNLFIGYNLFVTWELLDEYDWMLLFKSTLEKLGIYDNVVYLVEQFVGNNVKQVGKRQPSLPVDKDFKF